MVPSCAGSSSLKTGLYPTSPVWESLCLLKSLNLEKALLQRLQSNSFPQLWESLWLFRLADWEKALSHWLQANCFCPVCVSFCVFSWLDSEKALTHWVSQTASFMCGIVCVFLGYLPERKPCQTVTVGAANRHISSMSKNNLNSTKKKNNKKKLNPT